jgi:4-amino-4-deoxy-L-arabinose transferase-like glycosyltransferase
MKGGSPVRSGLSKNLLIGILVLALGTRLAVAMLTTSWVFPTHNNFWSFGYEMGQIAASLALGDGFSWPAWSSYPEGATSWMAPVFPLMMAATFKIFGIYSPQAAITLVLFLTIVSTLNCLLLYFIGQRLYNAQVGLLAAFLFAIYPPSIYYAVRNLWDTTLFTCCLLLNILMFLKLVNHPTIKGGSYLGILLGFTALVNPMIVAVCPFALAWLYLKSKGDQTAIIKIMACMLVVFFLVISPWLARNYLVFDQFAFIKSNFGHELYKGINGADREEPLITRTHLSSVFTESERLFLEQSNEATRNKFLLQKGVTFIIEHPLIYMKQILTRFAYFWTSIKSIDHWKAKISLTFFIILLMLSIIGLLLSKMNRRDTYFILLVIISLPLPYYFTISGYFRYRFPIEPLLIIFAAYTIYRIISYAFPEERSAAHQLTPCLSVAERQASTYV